MSTDPTDPTIRQLRLRVPIDEVDVASDRIWCAGAAGVEEVEVDGETIELRTVLGGSADRVRERLGTIPDSWELEFAEVDQRPAATWRDHVGPVRVTDDLYVVPAWWTGEAPSAETVLRIQPGDAFGLGDHPTTRLCLAALAELDLVDADVLDVGCGSGVLGVYAARRGARTVTAIDIADAAVEATEANARANDVRVTVSAVPIGGIDGRFDVVCANILAPVLVSIADDLVRVLAPGGVLLISGVLENRYDHVAEALQPLTVVDEKTTDGWVVASLRRPAGRADSAVPAVTATG